MNLNTRTQSEIPTEFPHVITNGNVRVKIFRVNSPKNREGCYYQVADHSGPKRRLISKADFWEAEAEAKRIAKLQRAGEHHALAMKGPERASYGRAVELLTPSGVPLEIAAAHFAEAVRILGGDKVVEAATFFAARHPSAMASKTVSELVTELLQVKSARRHAPRYLEDLTNRLNRFQEAFTGKLADVDTRSVQNWLDGLRSARGAQGGAISNQTYKNYRAVVGLLFKFAETRGYIARGTNPVDMVERPKIKREGVKIFTPAEFAALLNAADTEFLPALAIGGFAGLRSAEIQRLEWEDVHLSDAQPFIRVKPEKSKTGEKREVDICPALAAWLAPYRQSSGPLWMGNDDSFCDAEYKTAKGAGITWKANALRHSFGSYLLAQTRNAPMVADQMGNSVAVLRRRYKEVVRPAEATAWFSIMPTTPANVALLPAV